MLNAPQDGVHKPQPFQHIPPELTARDHWVVWRWEPDEGKKARKPPYSVHAPDGPRHASCEKPEDWGSFAKAVALVDVGKADGIGYALQEDDGIVFVDLDAELPETERMSIILALDSYSEVSPSGTGHHVLLKADLNGNGKHPAGLGVFESRRFAYLTGELVTGMTTTIEERQVELERVLGEHLPKKKPKLALASVAPQPVDVDDEELLRRMLDSPSGEKIRRLWDGDLSEYGNDASVADMALVTHLAWWTNRDPGRIDRMFRASRLYRAKWERADYRELTISKAVEQTQDGYTAPKRKAKSATTQKGRVNLALQMRGTAPVAVAPEPQEETFRLDVLTAKATCALPGADEDDQLLGPLAIRGQRLVVGGHTGEGKTTFTLLMLRAIVEQTPFLEWTGAGGKALVIDAEQGLRSIQRRLHEAGLDESENVDYIRVPDGLALNSDKGHIAEVERVLEDGQYSAVCLDPLYKLHTGESNAEREAVDLMKRLDAWRAELGFLLVLPVHCRKPLPGTKFSIHDLFGSSAYVRGAEVVLGLQRVGDGYGRLHFLKDRDGDLPIHTTWGLLFDREQGFRRDPNSGRKPTALEQIRELVTDEPTLSTQQLVEITGLAERTVRKAVKDLKSSEQPELLDDGIGA